MTVCVPHELYRTPRLRQAARTLQASRRIAPADNDEIRLKVIHNLADLKNNIEIK